MTLLPAWPVPPQANSYEVQQSPGMDENARKKERKPCVKGIPSSRQSRTLPTRQAYFIEAFFPLTR